jgi:translation initiation factor IF-2
MPMSGSSTQDAANRGKWIFNTAPVTKGTCSVSVYIPNPPGNAAWEVDGASATYGIYAGSAYIGGFRIDQITHRGQWITISGIAISSQNVVIYLFDRGIDYNTSPPARYGVGAVGLNCAQ